MLAPFALCSLARLKADFGITGAGKDAVLESAINQASREIEAFLGRRIVFRAPTEDADAIVTAATLATGSLALAGQPSSGRCLVVTVTDADRSLTAGTLVVTGTVAGAAGVTETFDLARGPVLYGVKFFTAVSAAAVSGLAGNATGDTVQIGTSLGYVDYYTPSADDLLPLVDWPVRQVLTLHEDPDRAYAAAALLAEGADYLLAGAEIGRHRGALQRISGSQPALWYPSLRAVKVVHSAGYFTRATVPDEIAARASRLAKLYFDDGQRGTLNISGGSDPFGNRTFYGRPGLDRESMAALSAERAFNRDGPYPERDFDLEAA